MPYSDYIAHHVERMGISKEAKRGLLIYCQTLENRGLPPILSLRHLASLVGIEPAVIGGAVASPHTYYRTYSIPKRRGGRRQISAPRPYLAHTQRWILHNILETTPIHHAATGFREGEGIIANAKAHVGNRSVLKMDVQDFFGSITRVDVEQIFSALGYSPKIAYVLSRLTTLHGRLPQGAPTSPTLSNIFMKSFDETISRYSDQKGLRYTRYADDIAISGPSLGLSDIEEVKSELALHGLISADNKTRLAHFGQKRIVTGISISSGQLKLPRDTRRRLRQELHYITKYGIKDHLRHLGRLDPIYAVRLAGQFRHWTLIEPTNSFAAQGLAVLLKLARVRVGAYWRSAPL